MGHGRRRRLKNKNPPCVRVPMFRSDHQAEAFKNGPQRIGNILSGGSVDCAPGSSNGLPASGGGNDKSAKNEAPPVPAIGGVVAYPIAVLHLVTDNLGQGLRQ